MKTPLFLILITLIIASCSKKDCDSALETSSFIVDKEYCLNDGDDFVISDINDSRCPSLADCIWAGEVILDLNIVIQNERQEISLVVKNNGQIQEFEDIPGYVMVISDVSPYPESGPINNAKDYTIKMMVKKK